MVVVRLERVEVGPHDGESRTPGCRRCDPATFVDIECRSCFDSALWATLSTNGLTVRLEETVRPERSSVKSKGEPNSALLLPPQIKKDSYSNALEKCSASKPCFLKRTSRDGIERSNDVGMRAPALRYRDGHSDYR